MPRTVCIETTSVQAYAPVLETLFEACRHLGLSVIPWRRNSYIPPECDMIWWGCNITPQQKENARKAGCRQIFLERGFTIDRDSCFTLDLKGTGGLSSWAEEPLEYTSKGNLEVRSGDLLVCLRYERDYCETDNVRQLSPFFRTNVEWLQHLQDTGVEGVRLRPHPVTTARQNAKPKSIAIASGWTWDTQPSFLEAVKTTSAVAVIDSTAGVHAMELGLPVLTFGRQVYRHPGVSYCLDNNLDKTKSAISQIVCNYCSLDTGAISAILHKIRSKQWYAKDSATFPERLRREFSF